jgi:uncharacterized protein (TIGR02145 family)
MRNVLFVSGFLITFVLMSGCREKSPSLPILSTSPVTDVTIYSAVSGGKITSDGRSDIIECGVCWNIYEKPTVSDYKEVNKSGAMEFVCNIGDLNPNVTYYVRAYAYNSVGIAYGDELTFGTLVDTAALGNRVTDLDGNVYNVVTIGTQVWMKENLKTTKYNNGTVIRNEKNYSQWKDLTTGVYCDFNNDLSNSKVYGKLYNWFAVSSQICPTGWHVPSNDEYLILFNFLGGENVAGAKMKEAGTAHWEEYNDATNSSGFTALPGGHLDAYTVTLDTIGYMAILWTKTEFSEISSMIVGMSNGSAGIGNNPCLKIDGASVRCLKNE